MTWARRISWKQAWIFVVLAAFLARAGFAAGYMPNVDTITGEFTVTMCAAGGSHVTTVKIPLDAPKPKAGDQQNCPFAQAHASVLPTPLDIAEAAEAYVFAVALTEKPARIHREPRQAHAPPTGPPSFI